MAIDLNALVKQAFSTIRSTVPDAIVQGKLIKYSKTYDRATAKYTSTVSNEQAVECVFDELEESFRTSENSNTVVAKIHLFGLLESSVDMFDVLELQMANGPIVYKTSQLENVQVGTATALHTFIVTN